MIGYGPKMLFSDPKIFQKTQGFCQPSEEDQQEEL